MITNSNDDTLVRSINDVMLMERSQDNILTTVDNIALQSNMNYTAHVSFSNLDGEFNITSSDNFSKFIHYSKSCNLVIVDYYMTRSM